MFEDQLWGESLWGKAVGLVPALVQAACQGQPDVICSFHYYYYYYYYYDYDYHYY